MWCNVNICQTTRYFALWNTIHHNLLSRFQTYVQVKLFLSSETFIHLSSQPLKQWNIRQILIEIRQMTWRFQVAWRVKRKASQRGVWVEARTGFWRGGGARCLLPAGVEARLTGDGIGGGTHWRVREDCRPAEHKLGLGWCPRVLPRWRLEPDLHLQLARCQAPPSPRHRPHSPLLPRARLEALVLCSLSLVLPRLWTNRSGLETLTELVVQ